MAILKSKAVVLRNRDFKETSFIVSLYTKDYGKISGLAKGARRTPPKFTSAFLPFSLNEVVFYSKREKELCIIAQCDLVDNFQKLRENLTRISYASYLVDLVESFTPLEDRNERIFNLLVDSLRMLEEADDPAATARIFEVKMLDLLGFMPQLTSCVCCGTRTGGRAFFSTRLGGVLCPECIERDEAAQPLLRGTIASLAHIHRSRTLGAARLDFAGGVGEELKEILERFLDFHLDRRLKSRAFLEKINAA